MRPRQSVTKSMKFRVRVRLIDRQRIALRMNIDELHLVIRFIDIHFIPRLSIPTMRVSSLLPALPLPVLSSRKGEAESPLYTS